MLALIVKMLKVLNSEASPWQIGWAIALGVLAGLLPFGFLTLFILLITCLFTVNLATFFLVWGLSSILMVGLSGPLEALTWQYAQQPELLRLLASSEWLQFLHLHYTLVLGAFVLGILLLLPLAWLSAFLVKQYRQKIMSQIQKWKVVQALQASKVFQLYQRLS